MDEKDILNKLGRVSNKLVKVGENIKNDNWDMVGKLLSQVNGIQEKIKNSPVSVETFLAQSPSFKKEYTFIKGKLLEQIKQNNAAIEEWKVKHTEKIASSKNALDNISKYYKPPDTSYYIDRKE
jgi:hypothetical protein